MRTVPCKSRLCLRSKDDVSQVQAIARGDPDVRMSLSMLVPVDDGYRTLTVGVISELKFGTRYDRRDALRLEPGVVELSHAAFRSRLHSAQRMP